MSACGDAPLGENLKRALFFYLLHKKKEKLK